MTFALFINRGENAARKLQQPSQLAGNAQDIVGEPLVDCPRADADCSPEYRSENAIIKVMKRISIQDLKATLSSAIAEAEAGGTILVTRHNTPVAQLTAARPANVYRGRRVGRARIKPALSRATRGRYLDVLAEDRGSR